MCITVVISRARGAAGARRTSVDLSRRRRRRRRGRRRHRAGDRAAPADDRPGAVQRSLADRDPDADARRGSRRTAAAAIAAARRRSRARVAASSTRRRTAWCTARPTCCRRSWSIATATTWSCRRCRRAWIGCCRDRRAMLRRDRSRRPASWRATIRKCARSRDSSRPSRCCTATIPRHVIAREGPVEYQVDLRRGRRPGCFSISGRTGKRRRAMRADACSTASATTAGSRCGWRGSARSGSHRHFGRCRGRIRANAARNGVPHLEAREANVFDELRRLERAGARYDTIVLDPPAFAKNKAAVPNALAGYKEINLRAMRLLSPGGT